MQGMEGHGMKWSWGQSKGFSSIDRDRQPVGKVGRQERRTGVVTDGDKGIGMTNRVEGGGEHRIEETSW